MPSLGNNNIKKKQSASDEINIEAIKDFNLVVNENDNGSDKDDKTMANNEKAAEETIIVASTFFLNNLHSLKRL